jgi:putative oxidoreductase
MQHSAVNSNSVPVGKGRTVVLWVLQILAGLAFLAAGGAKLAGAEQMVAVFATIGIGQWFRYLTGALEVIGAIGLFLPRYAFYAAALLVCVMAGAVMAHLTVLGGSPAAPLILLVITGTIAYLRRPTEKSF